MVKACVSCVQAGLRSELEIATDEMERAQQRLATLEREKDILLQGTSSPTAAQAANKAPPNKLVEESLRNELQNQVRFAPFHTFYDVNLSCELSQETPACELEVQVSIYLQCLIAETEDKEQTVYLQHVPPQEDERHVA